MEDILRRGRFKKARPKEVAEFSSSLEADRRIFEADLMVDYAHTVMLAEQGVIPKKYASKILSALKTIEERGYDWVVSDLGFEDIHVAIETRLIEMVGEEVGGRIHTGRSRNDEVAACIRIALREGLLEVASELLNLMETLLSVAEENRDTLAPGYTHTQHAQPVLLAHHLLAYFDVFRRDLERMIEAYRRVNLSPLGAAALAGSGFPLDRRRTAELLGFEGIVENTMDAVASRDFAVEALACLAILGCNLSRLAEELILWCTSEFGYLELDDAYASTSSIMPQKKNPDVLELTRSKTGRLYGNLVAALTIMKALPYTYDRDMQDLTPHLWDSVDCLKNSLRVVAGAMATCRFNRGRLEEAVQDFSTATELADTLVREADLPFRTAHTVVAALVAEALARGLKPSQVDSTLLDEVAVKVYGKGLGIPDGKVRSALDPRRFVESRRVTGSPNPDEVSRMISDRKARLEEDRRRVEEAKARLEEASMRLREAVDSILAEPSG